MMTTEAVPALECNDAELVTESLKGDREAFRQIVERYQTLIASLAFCATGNVTQSEDLAQETFVRAWNQLGELREPAKLRSWLCSIARFLISKDLRRQGREPTHRAEPLESVDEWASPDPLPPDHAISEEEKAILWRSLERIPDIYREPLVLFYREHQSIEVVAQHLDLTEDAVRQRLSRGRKLLQEQLLAFVAGALRQTSPGQVFTLGVIAALPLLATSAQAATATAAASKGGSAAKAAAGGSTLAAFFSGGMLLLVSLFAAFGLAGRWLGRKMGLASRQSPQARKRITQFWRTLAIGFLVLVLPPTFLPKSLLTTQPWLFQAGSWSLAAFYWVVAIALGIWIWQRRRDARRPEPNPMLSEQAINKRYNLWVFLGMAGPAVMVAMFVYAAFFTDWAISTKSIPEVEARALITERSDAQFAVHQYRDGSRWLYITLPEEPRVPRGTLATTELLADLNAKGITWPTLVEDRDFHNGGVRGWLVLLCTFITVAGAVLLLRRPGTKAFYEQQAPSPQAQRRMKLALGACAALALLAMSGILVLFTLAHPMKRISAAEAVQVIASHPDAQFEVFQYRRGPSELWITPKGSRHYPGFVAPADGTALALLAEQKIACPTRVQGRDFGWRGPSRWVTVACSVLLTAAALVIAWRAVRKSQAEATPA